MTDVFNGRIFVAETTASRCSEPQTYMQKDEFILFLSTRYRGQLGRHLSLRGASDATSRLRRIERTFDFKTEDLVGSLDRHSRDEFLLAIDNVLDGDPKRQIPTQALNDGRSAALKYWEFLKWKSMRAEALEWQAASKAK